MNDLFYPLPIFSDELTRLIIHLILYLKGNYYGVFQLFCIFNNYQLTINGFVLKIKNKIINRLSLFIFFYDSLILRERKN